MATNPGPDTGSKGSSFLHGQPGYRALFEIAPDAIFVISAEDGKFLALNPAFEALSGWPAEAWIGKPFAGLVHREDLPLAVRKFQETLLDKLSPDPYELRIRTASGEYLISEIRGAPLVVDGRIVGKIGVARDISERKRMEGALRFLSDAGVLLSSSLDYDTTLATIAHLAVRDIADWCVVDIVRKDGSLQRLAVAHRSPGKEDLIRELQDRFPHGPPGSDAAKVVIANGEPALWSELTEESIGEMVMDREYGRLIRELGTCSAMRVPMVTRGETIGAITFVVGEDSPHYSPTDLRLAEELAQRAAAAIDNARLYAEAQQALELRDTFLAIAAHELRGPIGALSLQMQMLGRHLRREPPNVERLALSLLGAEGQVARLTRLVDELMDVSRLTAGHLELDLERVDLAALTREVADRFADASAEAESPITVHADGPVSGRWDAMRLDQVLTNLISNALKYGRGAPVDIDVAADGDQAVVTIRDQGIGIPPDQIDRIFDRYERAHDRHKYKGLGLGLYIVREIVKAHGGTARAESEPGNGATFTVTVPTRTQPLN